ncbi:MAG: DUF3999 family protein [Candidatus Hydrogenedentota bacterium]
MAHPILLSSCLVLVLAAPAEGAFDEAGWRWRWPIEMAEATDAPFARLQVTPELADAAAPDLRDIRIVDGEGGLVPYLVDRPERREEEQIPRQARLLNRTYEEGEYERVVLDFGASIEKDQIQAELSGRNYRRRAMLEGSSDGEEWATIRDDALLFHIAGPEAEEAFKVDTIRFPVNTYRYLRLTVYTMPEEEQRFEIRSAECVLVRPAEAPPLIDVGPAERHIETDPETNVTSLELDLEYRHLPVDTIEFDVEDSYFHRGYEILGRNEEILVEQRRTETGPEPVEREAPWRSVARGVLYRIRGEDGIMRENTVLEALDAPYRYLKIRIRNEDNAPLTIAGLSVKRRELPEFVFEHKPGQSYTLYAGNTEAAPPAFDLAEAAPAARGQQWPEASLGRAESIAPPDPLEPWTERYHAVIWAALLIAAGALGLAVYRAMGNLSFHETGEDGQDP